MAQALSLCLAAADFSHRAHLKLKLECTACHTAAASSTRAEDNLLPSRDVCRRCHTEVTIKAPRQTFVARFSHQQHLKLGNAGAVIRRAIERGAYLAPPGELPGTSPCTACHRGLELSDAVSKANFPQMADCLVCHSQIDPPDSCAYCHVPGPDLQPASHVAGFLDSHSRREVAKTGCAVCHGKRFTCAGCH